MTCLRATALALAILALGVAGCGGDDEEPQPAGEAAQTATDTTPPPTDEASDDEPAKPADGSTDENEENDAELARRPAGEDGLRVPARRARIVAESSEFGRVLFDANGQVVYVFENDRPNRSNCASADCVEAWPPVLTREPPTAGAGVDAGLLGTIRRGDGRLQVTYDGRPLYFYEHEGPGEIRCHNVDLHGGLWWVVTPGGDPAA